MMDAYEYMSAAAEKMDRDTILRTIEDSTSGAHGVPSLVGIHERMQHVEALAEVYHGREGWDSVYLLEVLMKAHERFRDWVGAYA